MRTKKGRELAEQLGNGASFELVEACSLLCKAATSYSRIQEAECNGHPAAQNPHIDSKTLNKLQIQHEKWCEKRNNALEKVIKRHVNTISELAESYADPDRNKRKVTGVFFQGDPRGATVLLIREGDRLSPDGRYSTDYLYVPGS